MSQRVLVFIGACALFWSVVSQAIPQSQQDAIVQDVINALGRYDAAEIERRVRLWELDQPLPVSTGKVNSQGPCNGSCAPGSGGDKNFPSPRNVQFAGATTNGSHAQNFMIEWQRPTNLSGSSPYQLTNYRVYLTLGSSFYTVYDVSAQHKSNGQPVNYQTIKFSQLPKGTYTVQIQAEYADGAGNNTASLFTTAVSAPINPVNFTVADLSSSTLQQCALNNGHNNSTPLINITHLDCSGMAMSDGHLNIGAVNIKHMLSLRYLNLSNNSFTLIAGDLEELPWLSWLNLSGNPSLLSYTFGIPGLDTLEMRNSNVQNPIDYTRSNVSYLDFSDNGINVGLDKVPDTVQYLILNDINTTPDYSTLGNKPIEVLELKNSSLTDIAVLSGLDDLKYLDLDGSNLSGDQSLSGFTGFCGLSIKGTSMERLLARRPVQQLDLSDNINFKAAQAYTSDPNGRFFIPNFLNLQNNDALTCAHLHNTINNWNTQPKVDMTQAYDVDINDDGVYEQSPICPAYPVVDTFNQPNHCKPNKPQSIAVYEDVQSVRRYVTWTQHPNHDWSSWGVIGFEVKAFDAFDHEIGSYYVQGLNSRSLQINSLAAAYYQVAACTAHTCGYKRTSGTEVSQGLAHVDNLVVEWDTTDINALQYRFKFTYPQDAFDNDPYGRPYYFKVSAGFSQPEGVPQSFDVPVGSTNGNHTGMTWVTDYIARDHYIGDSFRIQACNAELGCGGAVQTVLSEAMVDLSLPTPQWTANGVSNAGDETEIVLQWHFGGANTDAIDYIEVIESQPVFNASSTVGDTAVQGENSIKYYTDDLDGPLTLKRITKGLYDFTLRACQRNRDAVDVCSGESAAYSGGPDATILRGDVFLGNPNIPNSSGLFAPELAYFNAAGTLNWVLDNNSNALGADYYYFKNSLGYTCQLDNLLNASEFVVDASFMNSVYGSSAGKCQSFTGYSGWKVSACKYGAGCTPEIDVANSPPQNAASASNFINPYAPPTNRSTGGPGDVHPGIFRHADSPASGWYFFWANSLEEGNNFPLYGNTYDLVAYWFTHEEVNGEWTPVWYQSLLKHTQGENFYAGSIMGYTKSGSILNPTHIGELRVYLNETGDSQKIRLGLDLNDDFGVITQITDREEDLVPFENRTPSGEVFDGLEIQLEDFALITFGYGDDCSGLNQTESCVIEHEDGSTTAFGFGNDADHYSGIWQKNGGVTVDPEVTLLTWIERSLEFSTVATFDSNGHPIWFTAQSCNSQGCIPPTAGEYVPRLPGEPTHAKNLYVVNKGAAPLQGNPIGYNVSDHLVKAGNYKREFAYAFDDWAENDYNKAKIEIKLDDPILYPEESILNPSIATEWQRDMSQVYGWPTAVSKVANRHGINFTLSANLDDPNPNDDLIVCDPNLAGGTGACELRFSWFTNDDFAEIKPFYALKSNVAGSDEPQAFEPFAGGANGFCGEPPVGYAIDAFFCTIDQSGIYYFELRKPRYHFISGEEEWEPIARTAYRIEVKACNSDICQGLVDTIPVRGDQPLVQEAPRINHVAGSGPLPGSGGVSGGAANYNIPLTVPPGRNGMTPELSVNYSSRGGNGVLGVGWSVSAGSGIYRCAKTHAQDGDELNSYAVTRTTADRLCLDGQRLMRVNGDSTDSSYWASDAEYRTEQESFSRISRAANNQFKVQTKAGITRIYEQKTSYDNSQGQTLAHNTTNWYVTQEYDSYGNLIEYEYSEGGQPGVAAEGSNEWLLTRIKYTGFKQGQTTNSGNRVITFDYVSRKDLDTSIDDYNKSYLWGQVNVRSQKLNTITTQVGGTVERVYRFQYRNSVANNALLLTRVEESADNGLSYRTLAQNSWSDDTPYGEGLSDWSSMADNYVYSNLNESNLDLISSRDLTGANAMVASDYDGDGIKEHIVFPRTEGSLADAKILFFNPDGSLKAVIPLPSDMDDYTNWVNVAQPGDFNSDGYTDFVISRDGAGFEIYSWINGKTLTQGSSETFAEYFAEVGDDLAINYERMDFDPGDEMILADRELSKVYFIDFNNDGKHDILLDRQPLVGDNGGDNGLAEMALYINTTDFDGNNSAISVDARVAAEQIILEHQPSTDWEPEADVRAIVWEKIEGIEDLNGDGIPDVRMKRLVAIGELPPLDSGQTAVFIPREFRDVVEFMTIDSHINGVPQFSSERKSIEELGLNDFNCLPKGTSTPVPCVEDSSGLSLTGGQLNELDTVIYRFVDVNNDGLKDFLYYNHSYATVEPTGAGDHEYVEHTDIEKYWKVRLNKGGLKGSATLFDTEDIESVLGSAANAAFIPDAEECGRLYAGQITDSVRRKELQRICHPIFRKGVEFADINGDGVSELLYPDYSSNGLVFNHCTRPPTSPGNATKGTIDFRTLDEDKLEFIRLVAESQLESEVAVSSFITNTINKGLPDNPDNPSFDCLVDNCGVDILNRSVAPILRGNTPDGSTVPESCSVEQLDKGLPSYYDFTLSNFLAPVKDHGLYKYKAIEFNLESDGTLGLNVINDTGLYKSLQGSSMGDLTGDGLLDDFSAVGCVNDPGPHCVGNSQYLSQNAPASWDFEQGDFNAYGGFALMTKNQATMPNMLTMVTKPKGDTPAEAMYKSSWVTWDYAPISESEELYTVTERHPTDPLSPQDGYLNNLDAAGEYFYFYSSMYVVKAMEQSNGTQVNGAPDFGTTSYKYVDAVYNNEGRGFQGFHKIYVTNKPSTSGDKFTTTSESTFHQVFPLAGKLSRVETKPGFLSDFVDPNSRNITTQIYDWPTPDYSNTSLDPHNKSNHKSAGVVFYPMLGQVVQDEDPNNLIISKVTQSNYGCDGVDYDSYGNLLCEQRVTQSFADDTLIPFANQRLVSTETVTSRSQYEPAEVLGGDWWIDKKRLSSVERTLLYAPGYDGEVNANDLNHQINTTYVWHNNTQQRKLKCQITQPEGVNLISQCSDDLSPAGLFPGSYEVSRIEFEYDTFGNIRQATQQGRVRSLDGSPVGAAADLQLRVTETEYGGQGYFPTGVMRKEGSVPLLDETYDYHPGTGQVNWSQSSDGVYTLNTYDDYDQLVRTDTCDDQPVNGQCPHIMPPVHAAMNDCSSGICSDIQSHLNDMLVVIRASYMNDNRFNEGFYMGTEARVPTITYVSQQTQVGAPQVTTYYDSNAQAVITKTLHSKAQPEHSSDGVHSGQESYVLNLTNPLGQQEISSQSYARHNNNSILVANDRTLTSNLDLTRTYPFISVYGYDQLSRVDHKLVEVGDLNDVNQVGDCQLSTEYRHGGGLTSITAEYAGFDCAHVPNNQSLDMARLYDASGRLLWTQGATIDVGGIDTQPETRYWYDASGNPAVIKDHDGNRITTDFDQLGRKLSVVDPNMGVKHFTYNGFGEVQTEQDSEGRFNHYQYDGVGRVIKKFTNVAADSTAISGVLSYRDFMNYGERGLLSSSERYSNEQTEGDYHEMNYPDAHRVDFKYATNRPWMIQRTDNYYNVQTPEVDNEDQVIYRTFYHYDNNYGRLKQVNYMNDFGVRSIYGPYGELEFQFQVSRYPNSTLADDTELLSNLDWNLNGQVTNRHMAGGVINDTSRYYAGTGQMAQQWHSSRSGPASWSGQELTYGYDAWGNLINKGLDDHLLEVTASETLAYDQLHRLTEVSGPQNKAYEYDVLGNLRFKSDFNQNNTISQYGSTLNAGPNAISQASLRNGQSISYHYDHRGNRVQDSINNNFNEKDYHYDGYDLLTHSYDRSDNQHIYIRYGADNQRYYKRDGFTGETTIYGGKDYERIYNISGELLESKFYVTDYLTVTRYNNQSESLHFMQKDRLGSTTQVLDEAGYRIHALSYDAFGKPRNPDWTDKDTQLFTATLDLNNPNSSVDITKRGFTDHEHLDDWQLVHMNGRMYDFNNGRFLSVDPFIAGAGSQALNPYSYIFNNPLSATDPSGYLPCKDEVGDHCEIPTPPKRKKKNFRGTGFNEGLSKLKDGAQYTNGGGQYVGVGAYLTNKNSISDIENTSQIHQFLKEFNAHFMVAEIPLSILGILDGGDTVLVTQANAGLASSIKSGKVNTQYLYWVIKNRSQLSPNKTSVLLDITALNNKFAVLNKWLPWFSVATNSAEKFTDDSLGVGAAFSYAYIDGSAIIASASAGGIGGLVGGIAYSLLGGSEGIHEKAVVTGQYALEGLRKADELITSAVEFANPIDERSIGRDVVRPSLRKHQSEGDFIAVQSERKNGSLLLDLYKRSLDDD